MARAIRSDDSSGGASTHGNRYCERIGLAAVPCVEAVLSRDLNLFHLMVVALLERGGPMTVEEMAERLTDAGAIAESGDMVLSLERAWHGREAICRDPDGQLGLNLSSSELDRMVWHAGLRPPRFPAPAAAPAPELPGDDVPLTEEEITAAFHDRSLYGFSGHRQAAAVLDVRARSMTVEEVQDVLAGMTRYSYELGADRVRFWSSTLVLLDEHGQLTLDRSSPDLAAMRQAVRKLARPVLLQQARREHWARVHAEREPVLAEERRRQAQEAPGPPALGRCASAQLEHRKCNPHTLRMIPRTLTPTLLEVVSRYPVVTITGPRQSGKTTLVRAALTDYDYVSLELPDERALALRDPRAFLGQFRRPAIIDEAQRAPDLFSYIQVAVDERPDPGRFVLTGSQNFLLLHAVSQSLAGRCAVLNLMPFSQAELGRRAPADVTQLGVHPLDHPASPPAPLAHTLFTGFYPRIHDRDLPPREWLANYYQTYLERDVRSLLNVGDIEVFGRFVRLCAARNAQLLNLSSLASDCGITHTTARRWLSVLEASFLVRLLRPHHRNLGKRLIKSPKLYFLDSGLLCFLVGVRDPDDLLYHAQRGAVFETLVLSELHKGFVHRGEPADIHFWRDATGREVDFVLDVGRQQLGIEVKSAQTIADDFFDGLRYWRSLAGRPAAAAALVYGGSRRYVEDGIVVHPWFVL